jgi:hypothetical protein
MNKRNITLLTAYLAICTVESDRAILEIAINECKSGNTPTLPIHITASLLLGSDELLPTDTDFVSDEFKARLEIAKQELAYLPIEEHIYSMYSEKKQAQDNGWVQNFTTKLKAGGITDVETQIVTMASSFLTGKKLNKILTGVDGAVKPMYEKLVEVAVKNEWAYLCIGEGKKAIAENREAVYPEFPKFD